MLTKRRRKKEIKKEREKNEKTKQNKNKKGRLPYILIEPSTSSPSYSVIQNSKRTHTVASLSPGERGQGRCYRKFRLVEISIHRLLSLSMALGVEEEKWPVYEALATPKLAIRFGLDCRKSSYLKLYIYNKNLKFGKLENGNYSHNTSCMYCAYPPYFLPTLTPIYPHILHEHSSLNPLSPPFFFNAQQADPS